MMGDEQIETELVESRQDAERLYGRLSRLYRGMDGVRKRRPHTYAYVGRSVSAAYKAMDYATTARWWLPTDALDGEE